MKLLILLSIFSFSVYAQSIDIQNFTGSIQGDRGSATADRYFFRGKLESMDPTSMQFEKRGDQFLAITDQGTFNFDLPQVAGNNSADIFFTELNIKDSGTLIDFNLDELIFSDSDTTKLQNAEVRCLGSNFHLDLIKKMLGHCTKDMNLYIHNIETTKKISNVNINTSGHRLNASAYIKEGWGYTVKAEGESYYNEEDNYLTLKIDKVTASGFNVTKKVWEELDEQNHPALVVQKPYVFIFLDSL